MIVPTFYRNDLKTCMKLLVLRQKPFLLASLQNNTICLVVRLYIQYCIRCNMLHLYTPKLYWLDRVNFAQMFRSCSGDARITQVIFIYVKTLHIIINITLNDCNITILLQYVITLHRILMMKVLFREGANQVKKVWWTLSSFPNWLKI